jgi:hypothetical protein
VDSESYAQQQSSAALPQDEENLEEVWSLIPMSVLISPHLQL